MTWNIASLPSGAGATLQIVTLVAQVGPIVNNAQVRADQFDPNLNNNKSSVQITGLITAGQISKRFFLSGSGAASASASQGGAVAPLDQATLFIQGSPTGPITHALPTFTWPTLSGADHYDLWVNDTTTGQTQVVRNQNVQGTTFTPSANLVAGHFYQWWVRSIAVDGTPSPWSEAITFNLVLLPGPTLGFPSGQINNALPTFTWNTVSGADHYDLWVDDTTTGQTQILRNQKIQGTSYTAAAPFIVGHSYQWWVRAISNVGSQGSWSNPSTFAEVLVGTPTPIGTVSNAGQNVTFSWQASVGADHYGLWVDDMTTGQSQVIREMTVSGNTWVSPALTQGHLYRWWVRAFDISGNASPWSDYLTFLMN